MGKKTDVWRNKHRAAKRSRNKRLEAKQLRSKKRRLEKKQKTMESTLCTQGTNIGREESSIQSSEMELDTDQGSIGTDEHEEEKYTGVSITRMSLSQMLAQAAEDDQRALDAAEQRRLQAAANVRESDVESDEENVRRGRMQGHRCNLHPSVLRFLDLEAGIDARSDEYETEMEEEQEEDEQEENEQEEQEQEEQDQEEQDQEEERYYGFRQQNAEFDEHNEYDEYYHSDGDDEAEVDSVNDVNSTHVINMDVGDGRNENAMQVDGEKRYCDNCKRREIYTSCSHYHLDLKDVLSTQLRRRKSPLCRIVLPSNREQVSVYKLCNACRRYMKARSLDMTESEAHDELTNHNGWGNTTFAFLSDLLFGKENNERGMLFCDIYGYEAIWKLIPHSLRPFWLHDGGITKIDGYAGCDLDEPKALFDDVTEQVERFEWDLKSHKLRNMNRIFSSRPDGTCDIIPHCLCPWGCSEFSFRGKLLDLPYILQKHLRKAPLNMPPMQGYFETFENIESSRGDFIREYEAYNSFLLNDDWIVRPSIRFVEGKGIMVIVCREHGSVLTRKRLHFHAPRKPGHTLCSETPCQLCHAVMQPRNIGLPQSKTYNSSFRMNNQISSFGGVSSAQLSTDHTFRRDSIIHRRDEALSVARRKDINNLLSVMVESNEIMPEFADDIRNRARRDYAEGSLDSYTHGSTYVNIRCSIILQNDLAHDNGTRVRMLSRCGEAGGRQREILTTIKRLWPPLINFMQMEDKHLYGYPFTAIKNYKPKKENQPVCMLWCLASCVMGCKELWMCLD